MEIEAGQTAQGGDCSRFCSCQSLVFQELSTPENSWMLNLKEFQEMRRVEHLVPNQIPDLIEIC
jgi:hypothetical protein